MRKHPTNDRNIPTQNTSRERSPQIIAGRRTGSFNALALRGTNLATTSASARKCKIRYGARFVLSFGRNRSAIGAGIADEKPKRAASVTAKPNNRKSAADHKTKRDAINRLNRPAPSSEIQAPITNRNCQAKGLK